MSKEFTTLTISQLFDLFGIVPGESSPRQCYLVVLLFRLVNDLRESVLRNPQSFNKDSILLHSIADVVGELVVLAVDKD